MSLIGKLLDKATDKIDLGINEDEHVVFYPSVGSHGASGDLRVQIRGRIFEGRKLLGDLSGMALALAGGSTKDLEASLGPKANEERTVQIFKERIRHFLLDGESREQFDIAVAGKSLKIPRSDRQGFFGIGEPWFTLTTSAVMDRLQSSNDSWLPYTAASNDRSRQFEGRSKLLHSNGVTVVSDVDDTIKDTNVPDKKELLLNTLFRPFKHISGMPETYQAWDQRNVQFIYLTNSPYQLFEPLHSYLQGEVRYPEGAYYMRHVGLDDLRQGIDKHLAIDEKVGLRENPKKHNLIPILEAFPNRKFVLIGDSTEMDADIYADLYLGTNFPSGFRVPPQGYRGQIKKILIREVACDKRNAAAAALARVGDEKVARFFPAQKPNILEDVLPLL